MQCVSSRRKISVKEEKEKGDTKGGEGFECLSCGQNWVFPGLLDRLKLQLREEWLTKK